MKKMNLKPGVKYKGYAYLNEYGEFEFTPAEIGKNQGKKRLLVERESFTVHVTDHVMIIHQRLVLQKENRAILTEYCKQVNELLNILGKYEF